MTAAVEVERCSPGVAAVQMHFADLDIKKVPLQPTPPSASVRIESNPIPPPADELAERLAELEKRPQTPPKDSRPVPAPLAKSNSKASDSTKSHQDSGYASIASSPEGLEPEKSQDSGFSSSKLRVFERPVPEYLQHRFYDLKVLYSEDLLKAVYKKNIDQKDLSMKLKYLGKSEPSAQLYIVVQCEAKFAKKVKKFFAQSIVQEYLGDDFKLHVINRAPRCLASAEEIKVYGQDSWATNTMCGQPIMLSNGATSVFATIGGVLQVSKSPDETPRLYGFTAAHSLISLIRMNTSGGTHSFEDDISESSDDNDDFDDDDDDEILFEVPSDDDLETDTQPFNIQNAGMLGSIIANSVEMPTNRDWSLVSLNEQSWLPNLLPAHTSSKHTKERALFFSNASLPFSYCASVTVITCRGPQQGILETNKSFLFCSPGAELIQTFDLRLEHDYTLRPGDSGSWVVDPSSGRVLGHVASIDAFGEAFVVPIQDTLGDIRETFPAVNVTLPSKDEIDELRSTARDPPPVPPAAQPSEAPPHAVVSPTSDIGQGGGKTDDLPPPRAISGNTLVATDVSASTQPGSTNQGLASAPSAVESASDPVAAPKKKPSSGKSPKSRFGDMVNMAKRFLSKPVAKPPAQHNVAPSMQPPIAPLYWSQAPAMAQQPGMPYPYYPAGMLDKQYLSNPHGISAYTYPQMYPMGAPPPQAISAYAAANPQAAVMYQAPGYQAPGYTTSGHDSGYSSLQPSAQCSPAPSPPSPSPRRRDEL